MIITVFRKPGRFFLRIIFYKVVVKLYRFYLFIVKRSGWSHSTTFNFFNQKLVHITVFFIALSLIFSNLVKLTKAQSIAANNASQTVLASLIDSEFATLEEEELIEEFFDQESSISPLQQRYLENLTALSSQPRASTNEIEEEEITSLTPGGTAIVKREMVDTDKVIRPREETVFYTVENGDTVSTIAQKFSISVNTILWANDLSAYSLIRPGDRVKILPVSGVSYKVAKGESLAGIAGKFGVSQDEIIKINKLASASNIRYNQEIIIPGGRKLEYAQYKPKTYSGISVLQDLIKNPASDKKAPSNARPLSGNKMNWPTAGYRITQYYSWKHHAIDIANKIGTPLYAADAGTIEYVGWGNGYGNQIVIDHGGGKKTRYAHLSQFYVKKGQSVSKGQTIGGMGSTGWSTGSHLHFEIIINGDKYNPLNYIK